MPTRPHRDDGRTVLAIGALLLLPALCCGLPLLIAGGALAGIGSMLGSPWVIGFGVTLVAGVAGWLIRRHASTRTADRECCSPTRPARESTPRDRRS
ncbi:MAG TPA: hypothetical protein VFX16_15910 [Pseudonocardiaceae bacterium]|nr:hypothetical protein [Pseudonocardiaceae bacterium]